MINSLNVSLSKSFDLIDCGQSSSQSDYYHLPKPNEHYVGEIAVLKLYTGRLAASLADWSPSDQYNFRQKAVRGCLRGFLQWFCSRRSLATSGNTQLKLIFERLRLTRFSKTPPYAPPSSKVNAVLAIETP